MKNIFYKAIIIFSSLFSTCSTQIEAINRVNDFIETQASDSLKLIMSNDFAKESLSFDLFLKKRNSIGLPSLLGGKEGFQIRLWEDYEKNNGILIVIDFTNGQWSAKGLKYKIYSSDNNWLDSLAGNEIDLGKPLSGWNKFMNTLLDYNILTLRDYNDIPGYFTATDMVGPSVEIAGHNYFRFYELPEPKYQSDKIKEAKYIIDIFRLINKEFPLLANK